MNDTPQTPVDDEKPAVSRSLYFVGGAVALAALSFVALVATKVIAPVPEVTSSPVPGLVSIDESLKAAEVMKAVVPVTFSDGVVDILYAGAPECSHCQNFMENGFDDLTAYAETNNLDLAYMPMAMSAMGVAIAAVEKCALPSATATAPQVVKAGYASVESIQSAAHEASKATKDGADEEEASLIIQAAMIDLHEKISTEVAFDDACYTEAVSDISDFMGSFSQAFDLKSTPSFYFSMPDGSVMRSVGSPDYKALKNLTK